MKLPLLPDWVLFHPFGATFDWLTRQVKNDLGQLCSQGWVAFQLLLISELYFFTFILGGKYLRELAFASFIQWLSLTKTFIYSQKGEWLYLHFYYVCYKYVTLIFCGHLKGPKHINKAVKAFVFLFDEIKYMIHFHTGPNVKENNSESQMLVLQFLPIQNPHL